MRQVNRIKKQRRPFTKEHFYIYECDNGMFHFRDRESHMVISTACDLASIKRCITIILNRYKNYDFYKRAFSLVSEKTVTEKDFTRREKEYKRKGHKYIQDLEDLIKEYYLEQDEKEDFKHRRVVLPVTPPPVQVEAENSPRPLGQVQLHKKRRSRL